MNLTLFYFLSQYLSDFAVLQTELDIKNGNTYVMGSGGSQKFSFTAKGTTIACKVTPSGSGYAPYVTTWKSNGQDESNDQDVCGKYVAPVCSDLTIGESYYVKVSRGGSHSKLTGKLECKGTQCVFLNGFRSFLAWKHIRVWCEIRT